MPPSAASMRISFISSALKVSLFSAPKEPSLPIRLLRTPAKCGMHPFPGVQPVIGRRGCAARNSEERAERVERVEAPIEPKRELVEIGLQMFGADPVMDAVDPGLQVGKDQVDDRQEFLCDLCILHSAMA